MKHFFLFSCLLLITLSCENNNPKTTSRKAQLKKEISLFNLDLNAHNNLSPESCELLYESTYSKKLEGKLLVESRCFEKGNFLWILMEFSGKEERQLFVFEKVELNNYQKVLMETIYPPLGECSISLEQQLVDLGDLIIVNTTGDGNGYCAYFPSFYKVNGSKLHLQNTLELVTYSFLEGQDYFTESSFSFSKKDDQVIIESESWNKFPDQEKKFKQTKSTQTFQVKGDSLLLVK